MRRRANLTTFLVMIVFLLDSSGFWHLARAKGPQADKAEEKKKTIAQLPAGANGSWWTAVQDQIRRAEYQIRWQEHTGQEDLEGAYQAPNRVQNLRTYFAPEGIRIIQRTESSPSWQWGVCLTGYGYAGDAKAVDKARLVVSGNRIEYRRGDVVEWYVNDEKGLEQGFTLAGPPEENEEETQKEIVLEMSVAGDLKGRMSKDGRTVTFATFEGKEVINYGGLIAKDAAGRELGSRILLSEDRIILEINTAGIRYPVTIDPVITSTPATADWTAEGNQNSAFFGCSVSTAGDVNRDGFCDVIVGSSSMAFVYHGSASGLSASANWTALGSSVGTAGDVNGDGYADVITGSSEKAFVYYGSATGLSAGPVWTLEGKQAGAGFGSSVGTAGDVNGDGLTDVIVGAYLYDNGQSNEGAAFVYYGRCWLKADLTGDCSIDYFDFSKLAKDWLQPSLVVDMTADSFVDYFDLDVLALYWLGENNPPPGPAANPNPPDGASTANYNADLSWTASLFAESHDVYFGTSSPPPFIGNQTATTFDPGTMTIGAKYYWRVNEVGPYATTRGNVWSFTIMPPPPPM
jgi:hypothetical protein